MCIIAIRNAGMKQDDIARVLNVSQSAVSRPLKDHRESGNIRKRKLSTLILECKDCCRSIMVRGGKGCYWDFELSNVPGPNSGIWC